MKTAKTQSKKGLRRPKPAKWTQEKVLAYFDPLIDDDQEERTVRNGFLIKYGDLECTGLSYTNDTWFAIAVMGEDADEDEILDWSWFSVFAEVSP